MRILSYITCAIIVISTHARTQKTNEVNEALRRKFIMSSVANQPGTMDKSLGTISVQAQNDMKNLADDPAQVNNPISKEEWASTLFGQRGILSGIFQMLDQQKKIGQSPLNDPAADSSGKINSNSFDFKRIVDALFKGPDSDTFGDPGPELPEFLGLCNRLSCGDIYKAIDQFRRSEFFSNFQTALSLIHDPNGWETIGNLLSNPELISQFTAGTGMEELFGSALGEAKKESAKGESIN
nr:Protein B0403.5 [Haemonchus contortus]